MLFEVRATAHKGLGLFATAPIPRGTRLLAEKPLVALQRGQRPREILDHAAALGDVGREQLLGLSWYSGSGVKRVGRWGEALRWALRSRRRSKQPTEDVAKNEKSTRKWSAAVPFSALADLYRECSSAVRILGIFRSNSFDLSSTSSPPSTSTATRSHKFEESATSSGPSSPVSSDVASDSISSHSPSYTLALFPNIARLNHSCLPNAQANFHPQLQTFTVHATRNIAPDEELTLNYLPEHALLRDARVAKLQEGYGFACDCVACDLTSVRGTRGEVARKKVLSEMRSMRALVDFAQDSSMRESQSETTNAGYTADGMPEMLPSMNAAMDSLELQRLQSLSQEELQAHLIARELALLTSLVTLYDAEGIAGREVASIHLRVARLLCGAGRIEEAVTSADEAARLERECLGIDHPGYVEASDFAQSLREMKSELVTRRRPADGA